MDIPYTIFPDLLKRKADETPNAAACIIIDDDNERSVLTCGEFFNKATTFAGTLVQMGVERGDIVGSVEEMFKNGLLLI